MFVVLTIQRAFCDWNIPDSGFWIIVWSILFYPCLQYTVSDYRRIPGLRERGVVISIFLERKSSDLSSNQIWFGTGKTACDDADDGARHDSILGYKLHFLVLDVCHILDYLRFFWLNRETALRIPTGPLHSTRLQASAKHVNVFILF